MANTEQDCQLAPALLLNGEEEKIKSAVCSEEKIYKKKNEMSVRSENSGVYLGSVLHCAADFRT